MARAAAKRPRQISHHARRWPTCGPTIKTYGYRPTSVVCARLHARAALELIFIRPAPPHCALATTALDAKLRALASCISLSANTIARPQASPRALHRPPRLPYGVNKPIPWGSFPTPFQPCGILTHSIKNGIFACDSFCLNTGSF